MSTPRASVTWYAFGPYVDETHVVVTTTIGDLAGSHLAAYAALASAGIVPTRSRPGAIRLTVGEEISLARAVQTTIEALRSAGLRVDTYQEMP